MPLVYLSNCVDWPRDHVRALEDLVDNARECTFSAASRYMDLEDRAALEQRLGYGRGRPMRKDPYVRYYKGRLYGHWVYFVTWSAIEHVFGPAILRDRLFAEPDRKVA